MNFQLVTPVYAASPWGAECQQEGVATIMGISCVIKNLLQPIPAIIGLVAVGVIIMAGIRLISAGSDPKAVAAAWNSFTYAILGLVLLAVVWLVLVIIQNVTGAQVTQFGV